MNPEEAVQTLAALGQATRLETFRMLVRAGPEGIAASDIAHNAGVPRNTMSAHLSVLARAGLVTAQRMSRQIIYRADMERLASLTGFLIEDCCNGRPELCEPMLSQITRLSSDIASDCVVRCE